MQCISYYKEHNTLNQLVMLIIAIRSHNAERTELG